MVKLESKLGTKTFASPPRKVLTVDDGGTQLPLPEVQQYYEQQYQQQTVQPQQQPYPQQQPAHPPIDPMIVSLQDMEAREAQKKRDALIRDRISPMGKQRIEILAGIGRIKDDLEIEGIKFSFQSIKAIEQKEIFDSAFGSTNAQSGVSIQFLIRSQTLARAVTHIDDQLLSTIVGSYDKDVQALVFDEMDENVSDFLYKWYKENIVKKGQDKYSLKNETAAEEVVEDIKK